jgi:multiple sugar transport system permease protein
MQPSSIAEKLQAGSLRTSYKNFFTLNNESYWWGYLFLLPNFLGFLVFTAGPFLAGFILSFYKWDMLSPPHFAMLDNYVTLLTKDELFWKSLINTLWYSVLSIPLGIICSLVLALALNRNIAGIAIYRTLYFIPVVSSVIAVSLVWKWFYNTEFGILNYFIGLLHIPPQGWLSNPHLAMVSVVVMSVWKGMGYNMVIFLAGLKGIPQHLYEAAEIDGATKFKKFWYITFPLLTPTLFFVTVMASIGSFQVFDQVFVMTQGGPGNATLVYNYYLYQNAFQFFKMGYASAMAYILMVIIFFVTLLQVKYLGKKVFYELG